VKVTYDTATDSLTVVLNEKASIAESDEDKPGVILDYDDKGNLVSLEVLDASKRVTEAKKIEFQTAGYLRQY
jgi:uncharacterized protein YuzE